MAAPCEYRIPIDSLDPAVLVRHIWFAMSFDDYVAMRLVSRRWRRLYIQSRRAACEHFLRGFKRWGEDGRGGRCVLGVEYTDRAGNVGLHGELSVLRVPPDECRVLTESAVRYRLGVRDGWARYCCMKCTRGVVKCVRLYRDDQLIFQMSSTCSACYFSDGEIKTMRILDIENAADLRTRDTLLSLAQELGLTGAVKSAFPSFDSDEGFTEK